MIIVSTFRLHLNGGATHGKFLEGLRDLSVSEARTQVLKFLYWAGRHDVQYYGQLTTDPNLGIFDAIITVRETNFWKAALFLPEDPAERAFRLHMNLGATSRSMVENAQSRNVVQARRDLVDVLYRGAENDMRDNNGGHYPWHVEVTGQIRPIAPEKASNGVAFLDAPLALKLVQKVDPQPRSKSAA